MNARRKQLLGYVGAGVLVLLPLLIAHANRKDPRKLNGFDRAVLRVSAPLQRGASWVVDGVASLWTGYVWLVDVDEENEELRAENDRLRIELSEARRRLRDHETLEDLVGLKEEMSAETIGARVIGVTTNPHFRVVRVKLDRGSEKLRADMPVLARAGLVGRTARVAGDYSDVLLLSDPQSSVDVTIPRLGARGVVTGLGKADSYACKIEYLESDKKVQVGDEVVTSGQFGVFPAGVPVGVISKVESAKVGYYQQVELEPAVDYGDLGALIVLLAPPPAPDPRASIPRRDKLANRGEPF